MKNKLKNRIMYW